MESYKAEAVSVLLFCFPDHSHSTKVIINERLKELLSAQCVCFCVCVGDCVYHQGLYDVNEGNDTDSNCYAG